MTDIAPRRRWFSFSLRTLFVVVAASGLFLAWLGVQVQWIRDRHEALSHYSVGTTVRPKKAPWSIRILGEAGAPVVVVKFSTSMDERERLRRLFPEAKVLPCE